MGNVCGKAGAGAEDGVLAECCAHAGSGKQQQAAAGAGSSEAVQAQKGRADGGGCPPKVHWQLPSGSKPARQRTPTPPPAHLLPTHGSHAAAAAGGVTAGAAPAGEAAGAASQQPPSKRRTDCKVKDAYRLGKTLGTGGFAIVKLATDRKSGQQYAVKIMTLPPADAEPGDNENSREDIFKEIDILCGLQHENVVYLKEYFEEGNKVYLITELVTGGELLEAVLQRGTYSEAEARLAFVQLLRGIQYLHSKNVVHRDLKLENLLLSSPDEITRIKIADFGLAKQSADAMSTVCGTPQYVAPEVIQSTPGAAYGPEVDMWSAGVVLFILLGGYPPFWNESEPALFEQIRRGRYNFDDPVWDVVSHGAKDLIRKLLVVKPAQRLTAAQCLAHPWVTAGQVPCNPLDDARSRMASLSMKAPGFAAALAAGEALAAAEEMVVGPDGVAVELRGGGAAAAADGGKDAGGGGAVQEGVAVASAGDGCGCGEQRRWPQLRIKAGGGAR